MAIFFQQFDLRRMFSAAPFTRSRQPFRGKRESHKVNLEMDQMYYAFKRLYTLYDLDKTKQDESVLLSIFGGEIDGVTLSDSSPLEIQGLQELSGKLTELETTISLLER